MAQTGALHSGIGRVRSKKREVGGREVSMGALKNLIASVPNLEFWLPDNTPVVRLGLIATVYFKEGYLLESKKKVMECFDRFKEEFGQHLKGQFDGRYKKLTDDNFKKNDSEDSWN